MNLHDVVRLEDITGVVSSGFMPATWQDTTNPASETTGFNLNYIKQGNVVTLYQSITPQWQVNPPPVIAGFVVFSGIQPALIPTTQWRIPVITQVGGNIISAVLEVYTNGNIFIVSFDGNSFNNTVMVTPWLIQYTII